MNDKLDILSSGAGQRMLKMVSPIYGRSYVGLWMMEAIGRAYDSAQEAVRSMFEQITPRTATWALPFWEETYGIPPDGKATIAQRRATVMARILSAGAFTPYKVKEMAEALTGVNARVVEGEAPYCFSVYLSVQSAEDERVKKEIERVKPAHLAYELKYELAVNGRMYFGCAVARGQFIEIGQVN